MGKESFTQIQETQWSTYKINPRRNTLRLILIKLTKIKNEEKILKAARENKQIIYKGTLIRLSADLSSETLQARREWHMIYLEWWKEKTPPGLLYPARLSFRFEEEIKNFTDKQKLREFSTTKPALQQILKELLYVENKRPQLETKILQMTSVTSKAIHMVKLGNHHTQICYQKPEILRRVQMQDTGDAFTIKRPAT